MAEDCVFCDIVEGRVETELVDEGDHWIAFRDRNPQAPTHLLVIPRRHVASLSDLEGSDRAMAGELLLACARVADGEGLVDEGYRVVANTNSGAGQTVFHLHLHVLGGRAMRWPPG